MGGCDQMCANLWGFPREIDYIDLMRQVGSEVQDPGMAASGGKEDKEAML